MLVLSSVILSALLSALTASARPQSYAVWAADSAIARKQGNGFDGAGQASVSYEHGELQWGLRLLYEQTKNVSYYNYILAGANNIVYDNGTVHGGYAYVGVVHSTGIILK